MESTKLVRTSSSTRVQVFLLDNLIWVIMIVLFFIFSLTIPNFFTVLNIHFMFYDASAIGMLVFAQALVLISGNMDLSVARNAGLTAMFVGMLVRVWAKGVIPTWAGIILMPVFGGLLGMVNGFLVGKLKINAFLATLSTFLIYDWMTYVINQGAIINLGRALDFPGGGTIFGFHFAILVLFAVGAVLYFLLQHTRFGAYLRAMGGNPEAAGMLGINLTSMNFRVFTIAGVLGGVSGLLYTGYLRSIPSTIATGDSIFLSFAGAIIGGVSLRGGEGSIVGALGGVLLLGLIDTGTTMTSVAPALRGVINGLILLLAILINKSRLDLRDRVLMPPQRQA